MATYTYDLIGGKIKAQSSLVARSRSFPYHEFAGISKGTVGGIDVVNVDFSNSTYSYQINPAIDVVILNGVTIAAGSQTATQLEQTLNASAVFLKPSSGGGGGSFADITGQPTDNANLATALNNKSNTSVGNSGIPAPNKTRTAWWGNSLIAGAGQTPMTTNFTAVSGIPSDNYGVGGETSAQIKARFNANTASHAYPTVFDVDFNDYSLDPTLGITKTNLADMIAALGHDDYIVMGATMSANGGFEAGLAGWINKMAYNKYLSATYGSHYFDVHRFIMGLGDLTLTADLTNYRNDIEPNSTRIDLQHYTSATNNAIGAELARRLKDFGIGTTALTRTEIQNISSLSPINIGGVKAAPISTNYIEANKVNILAGGSFMLDGLPVLQTYRNSYVFGAGSGGTSLNTYGTSNILNNIFGFGSGNNTSGNTTNIFGAVSGTTLTGGGNSGIYGSGIELQSATPFNQVTIHNALYMTAANGSGTTLAGNVGVAIVPSQRFTLPAGTATAGTAPMKWTSGPLLTTPVAGVMEYLTDRIYFTQSTGTTRQQLAYVTDLTQPVVDIVNTTVVNAVSGTKYYANHAGLSTLLLPTTAVKGSQILMRGQGAGGWKITQNANQKIHGASDSTTGTGGSLASQTQYDTVVLECMVANLEWIIVANRGTLTIV